MPRKWTNSKGIGVDHDRAIERSLERLRRELMKPEVYQQVYGRNKKNANNRNQRNRRR